MGPALRPACLPVLLLALAACQTEYAPPSLVQHLRVLGVRAEPPLIRTDVDTDLRLLAVGQPAGAALCHAWAFCPFAWADEGNFRCIDAELQIDLGTAPTATVGFAHVLEVLQKAPAVFEKLDLKAPEGVGLEPPVAACLPGGKAPAAGPGLDALALVPETYVLFRVSEAALHGGVCPTATAALSSPCPDRDRCVAGYKRLALAPLVQACEPFDPAAEPACANPGSACPERPVCGCDGQTYRNECARIAAQVSQRHAGGCVGDNHNPDLTAVAIRHPALQGAPAIDWPEGVTPTIPPEAELEVRPAWSDDSEETIGRFADPSLGVEKESLLFSWFSTAGDFAKQRTHADSPGNVFLAPRLGKSESERLVTLWLVLRDGRNGTDWAVRQVRVAKGTAYKQNPLCVAQAGLPGCP